MTFSFISFLASLPLESSETSFVHNGKGPQTFLIYMNPVQYTDIQFYMHNRDSVQWYNILQKLIYMYKVFIYTFPKSVCSIIRFTSLYSRTNHIISRLLRFTVLGLLKGDTTILYLTHSTCTAHIWVNKQQLKMSGSVQLHYVD